MEPLISIIIPTFKRFNLIKKAVKSISSQTFSNWEAIIIDNNSEDGTRELIKNLNDTRFKFFEIQNNGLISKSRNYGILKSNGNYLAFLDSDDWWSPNKLSYVSELIDKKYKFIYHNHIIYKKRSIFKKSNFIPRKLSENIFEDLLINGPNFATSSVTVEKKIFIDAGGFEESEKLISWEDYDAWLKVSKKTNSFGYINKSLSTIYIGQENYLNHSIKIKNINFFYEKYYKQLNNVMPNWCNIELTKNFYFLKEYSKALENFSKINLNKVSFLNKIKLVLLFILIKLKFKVEK